MQFPETEAPIYPPPPGKTATPTSTPLPDPADLILLGDPVSVQAGGFTFRPVTIWNAQGDTLTLTTSPNKASLYNSAQTLYFNLDGEPAGTHADAQDCLGMILQRMTADIPDLRITAAPPAQAAGLQGAQSDLSGTLFDQPMHGRLAVFHPDGRCFSLIGLSAAPDAAELWQTIGLPAFDKILSSLTFQTDTAPAGCLVSDDPAYGFSPEKPIRVGNQNLYDGIMRMEAYLNTLRGPENQEIFYTRQNPIFNQADDVVDVYEITHDGLPEPLLIYFDIYRFETPLALYNFTCEAAFPLQAP